MRWRRGQRSGDVIDARGSGGAAGGGGGLPFPMPTTGLGKGGGCLSLVLVLAALAFGGQQLVGSGDGGGGGFGATVDDPLDSRSPGRRRRRRGLQGAPSDDDAFEFSAYVFDDGQRSWLETFAKSSRPYRRAKLVVFSHVVNTGCGPASSATGPFYCPADEQRVPRPRLLRRAARALRRARRLRAGVRHRSRGRPPRPEPARRSSEQVPPALEQRPDQANELSVRLELQADCFAGVWAPRRDKRQDPRARRRRGGPRRRRRRRRRPHPAGRPAAGSRPRPSRTARPSSARAGCGRASTRATRTAATRSAASRRYRHLR